jgi:hypothetical protein
VIQELVPQLGDEAGVESAQHADAFTSEELTQMRVIGAVCVEACLWWVRVYLLFPIDLWGMSVSAWMHGCECHEALILSGKKIDCNHKGRRAAPWAAFMKEKFRRELACMDASTEATALILENSLHPKFQLLLGEFVTCRNSVVHRYILVFSYWDKLPWAVVKLYEAEVRPCKEARLRVVQTARQLSLQYDRNKASQSPVWYGNVADRFFSNEHPSGLRRVIDKLEIRYLMPFQLKSELQVYGTVLMVMQLLESRHHLANQKMVLARNTSLPTLSAALRRTVNDDTRTLEFKQNIDQYIGQMQSVLPPLILQQCGSSHADFVRAVYGTHAGMLHGSVDREEEIIQKYKAHHARQTRNEAPSEANDRSMIVEHMRASMAEGETFFMADSLFSQPDAEAELATDVAESEVILAARAPGAIVIEVVAAFPERKACMEKISHMSEYQWTDCVGVATMQHDAERNGSHNDSYVGTMQMEVGSLNLVQLYRDGVDRRLYKFQSHKVQQVLGDGFLQELLCIQDQAPASAEAEAEGNQYDDIPLQELQLVPFTCDASVVTRIGDAMCQSSQWWSQADVANILPGVASTEVVFPLYMAWCI